MKNIFNNWRFFAAFAICAAVLIFSGCGGKQVSQTAAGANQPASTGNNKDVISFISAKYQFKLAYPPHFVAAYPGGESPLVLSFPESYTTGTNLSRAEIRVEINKKDCEALGSGDDDILSWHYSRAMAVSAAFPEMMQISGLTFHRLKCSDAAMSHVGDLLSYVAEKDGTSYALSLFLLSANPEVYDEKIRPQKYDPSQIEAEYLQILRSFKLTNPL